MTLCDEERTKHLLVAYVGLKKAERQHRHFIMVGQCLTCDKQFYMNPNDYEKVQSFGLYREKKGRYEAETQRSFFDVYRRREQAKAELETKVITKTDDVSLDVKFDEPLQ